MKIFVVTHKNEFLENEIHLPLRVGGACIKNMPGFCDNTGENIAEKNRSYSELTAQYWIWKNFNTDYIGLCHYRRYFSKSLIAKILAPITKKPDTYLLSEDDVLRIMKKYEIILPKKRNYFIESVESHYANAHNHSDLQKVREIIGKHHPEYTEAFEEVMKKRSLHLYNMFIMNEKLFEKYSDWLFGILFRVEENIDFQNYDSYQERVFGFLGERLLNVWVMKNRLTVKKLPVANTFRIFWPGKIYNFLKRKYKGI